MTAGTKKTTSSTATHKANPMNIKLELLSCLSDVAAIMCLPGCFVPVVHKVWLTRKQQLSDVEHSASSWLLLGFVLPFGSRSTS